MPRAIPRKPLWIFIALLFWIFLNMLPRAMEAQANWLTNLDLTERIFNLIGTFGLLSLEFTLLLLIVGFTKAKTKYLREKKHHTAALLTTALTYLCLSFCLLLLFASIFLHAQTQVFLDIDHLHALAANPQMILAYTSGADRKSAASTLALALGGAACVFYFVPLVTRPTLLTLARRAFYGLLCASLCFVIIPKFLLNSSEKKTFQYYVAFRSTPSMALLWSHVFFPHLRDFTPIPLDQLATSYSKDDYWKRAAEGLSAKKQNVLIFSIEALRFDTLESAGGDPRILPNINSLARSGFSYQHAYAQSNESSYSRVTSISGTYPLRYQFRDTYLNVDYPLTRIYELPFQHDMKTSYFSSHSGDWQNLAHVTNTKFADLLFSPEDVGLVNLREFWPRQHQEGKASIFTTATRDYIATQKLKDWISKNVSEHTPFVSFMYLESSHFPYIGDETIVDEPFQPATISPTQLNSASFLEIPSQDIPIFRNKYFNALRFVDSLIGEIHEHLKTLGIESNTSIIITGDHGELFGEHGKVTHAGPLFEETTHVPFIIYGTEHLVMRGNGNTPVGHLDIAPTTLHLLGLPSYDGFQGTSLLAEPNSAEAKNWDRAIFSVVQSFAHQISIVVWPWKFIRDERTDEHFLFDLEKDSREQNNLVGEFPKRAHCLEAAIDLFRARQLTYYSKNTNYREKYFPPQQDTVGLECKNMKETAQ